MDASNEERKIFSEIQKRLFYMIPQRWENIYLYASIIEESFKKSKGEMFFYYYPKGILKKNPINVYEIPSLFNIDEETYNDLVNRLFQDIRKLHEIAREKHKMIWTSITITIENSLFKIEYNYDDIEKNEEFDPYERHVIWRYSYLGLDFDTLTKKEKDIIERYNNTIFLTKKSKEVYSEGMYKQMTHNIIDYAKTMSLEAALALQEGKGEEEKKQSPKKRLEALKNKKKKKDIQEVDNKNVKNQILVGIKNEEHNDNDEDFGDELLTSEKMTRNTRNFYHEEEEEDFGDELLTTEMMTRKKDK